MHMGDACHPPAAPVAVLTLLLLQDVVALGRRALVCCTLGDGVAVGGIALRLALVPWQLVCVILEELVASRPVLVALQLHGKEVETSKGLIEHVVWVISIVHSHLPALQQCLCMLISSGQHLLCLPDVISAASTSTLSVGSQIPLPHSHGE
jgi:hypothetical protein